MRRYFLMGVLPLLALFLGLTLSSSQAPPAEPLSAAEFQNLSLKLSERSGYFGTDNLVSNETSYLHVRRIIEDTVEPGQAYLGVGPDQNFTYIAQARPSIAFIVDIRRDNLLHHLYFKAIFNEATDRWRYLSLLFGRKLPDGEELPALAGASQLAARMEDLAPDREYFEANFQRLFDSLREAFPDLVLESDRPKVWSIASTFFEDGLQVRYEIPGRPMLTFFPSYAQLMSETDLDGNRGHYLDSEADYQFVRALERANRVIPVVGNFGGPKALKAVGEEVKSRGLRVSVFYLSNVEFYLFRSGIYRRFVENVASLPIDRKSLLVRSYFNNWFGTWRTHPNAVLNYFSTSLAQSTERFLDLDRRHPYDNYWDLVTRDYVGAPAQPAPVF